MRADIAKLTTERERRGSSHCHSKKYGGRVRIIHDEEHDYEDEFGGFRSSSRHRQQDSKDLSDVLTPLRGALRANLGRPWDKVYSEFCQYLDRRSVSGIHIFSHLVGFRGNSLGGEVEIRGLYVGADKKVYQHSTGRDHEVDGFYVHPVTGILRYAPRKYRSHGYHKRAVLESLREGKKVNIDGHDFELIDGCWFEVWCEKRTKTEWHKCWIQDREDVNWYKTRGYAYNEKLNEWGHWQQSQPFNFIVRKRSLNKKEIRVVKQYIEDRIEELSNGN